MEWKKLFERHILERGYEYYCENAVEGLDISSGLIQADVIGTEEYEVAITLEDGKVMDMYCSCPYASDERNCKHMAAVLFAWAEEQEQENLINEKSETDGDLFIKGNTPEAYRKKAEEIQNLIEGADIAVVRSFLASILSENEKLLVRFYNITNGKAGKIDLKHYTKQVDEIISRHLGREHFISYDAVGDFISELEDILDEDVRQMIDNRQYMCAFQLMNYIFTLIGDVDMDDSCGGTGMLADQIYQLWIELLEKGNAEEKQEMFRWFITHLDGSLIDYLEEYIEEILMEEFRENEYMQQKMLFVKEMLHREYPQLSEWSRNYYIGKWAIRYLGMMEQSGCAKKEAEVFCKEFWDNSSVRRYYIDRCIQDREYERALAVLDESISMDKDYRGLRLEYNEKKKEIYLLQGNKEAYLGQLWKLLLEERAGDLEIYRELKKQYTEAEWLVKREEIFEEIPRYARVDWLYKEEKLYDRLLDFVLRSDGLYALQEYTDVLKEEYPEQILRKYKDEVNTMASVAGNRKKYQQLVILLRSMKKIEGGSKLVEDLVADWKLRYRNRPAMMDELKKL